ncbi:MAG: dephospho-CoA kinase [Bacteroidales bacterium]|nr:dephospho-CoA kinase [Bacteroidales bacterium]
MNRPAVIAVTGGIGAGKSVVSRMLRCMGFDVYDTDSAARAIVDADSDIHARLNSDIHPQAVCDGRVDRPLIASVVFSDSDALRRLNSIVHPTVLAHFDAWVSGHAVGRPVFVETAILYECDLWRVVDAEWHVDAPADIRTARIMSRNGLTRQQALARITAQQGMRRCGSLPLTTIVNDGETAVLPQLHAALAGVL